MMNLTNEHNWLDGDTTVKRPVVKPPAPRRKWFRRLQAWFFGWCKLVLSAIIRLEPVENNSYKFHEVIREPWWCNDCFYSDRMSRTTEGWECPKCNASYFLIAQPMRSPIKEPVIEAVPTLVEVKVITPVVPLLPQPPRKRNTVKLHGNPLRRMMCSGQIEMHDGSIYYKDTGQRIDTQELKALSHAEMEALLEKQRSSHYARASKDISDDHSRGNQAGSFHSI